MTLVCCWLDQSYSRERITAIADARASFKDASGRWHVLVETTTKLLPVTVRCHRLSDFDPATSQLAKPYRTTEVVIGYAGYCFEALSIIEMMRRCCGQLLTTSGSGRRWPCKPTRNFDRQILLSPQTAVPTGGGNGHGWILA